MKTWAEMKLEIQKECNIEGEDFASEDELMTWANDAKDEAEKEIVSLYDRYLETEGYLELAEGESLIDLPDDIYSNKITGIWYDNGTERYEIKLIKKKSEIFEAGENDCYKFMLTNSAANGIKIKLVPESRETSTENVVIFYIRESQAITGDDSSMDIPLADGFIKQYIKDKVKEKELGPMNITDESPMMKRERRLLIEALNHMVPNDSADEIEMDLGFYEDFDSDINGGQ